MIKHEKGSNANLEDLYLKHQRLDHAARRPNCTSEPDVESIC